VASRFLYLCGRLFNNASRCVSSPVASPVADTLFPVAGLADGYTEVPFMFGSAGTDSTLTWDFNVITNGNMAGNSGGNLTTWVESNTGTGDVAYDATGGVSSSPGMKLSTGTTSTASAYQDISVRPGEELTLVAQLKSQTGKTIRLRVQNRHSMKWLSSAGAWQAAQTDVFTETGTSFVAKTKTFSVEAFAALLWPTLFNITLRIIIATDDSSVTGVWADQVYCWPSWSWFSIHGHDLPPQISVDLRRSTDNFAASDVSVVSGINVYKPAFYYALGSGISKVADQYARLKLTGTVGTAQWFGEVVFGQYAELVTSWTMGTLKVRRYRDQVRTRPSVGTFRALALGQLERRVWTASFQDISAAGLDDFLDNVQRASGYGYAALVFAPDDLDGRVCIYGQVPADFTASYINLAVDTRDFEVTEDPFFSFVA
jgi:hypothetical protein